MRKVFLNQLITMYGSTWWGICRSKVKFILRIAMTEYPFVHKKAYANAKTSFIYQHDFAKILPKLLKEKGIINIGGKKMTIYKFARKDNKYVKPIYLKRGITFQKIVP